MQPPSNQRFRRGSERFVGGVCSGLAEGLRVDVIWVRLAFVLLAFLQGIGVVLYVVLWVVMPEQAGRTPASRSGFDSVVANLKNALAEVRGVFGGPKPVGPAGATPADTPPGPGAAQPTPAAPSGQPAGAAMQNQSLLLGLALVLIGLVILANNIGFVRWDVFWPAVLIAFGVVLLARNITRKH